MITYLKNSEINKAKWDQCISGSFNSIVYAASWYLDLVHEDWEALVEDDYDRVMPLTGKKKFGINYIFQPYFTQQLGVFSKSILTPGIVKEFVDSIPLHYKYIDIRINSFNKLSNRPYNVEPNKNYVLDLIHDYEKIAGRYSVNTKRNLKKSAQSNLTFVESIKPEAIVTLFRDKKGKSVGKWQEEHYQRLLKLIYTAIYKGRGSTFGVFTSENQLCAGAFFLSSNNRLIFLFSGSNEIARENGAMTMLIDNVIRLFAPGNMVLDFEGSNDINLARFYRGFGSKESSYLSLRINRLSFPLKYLLLLYQKLKSFR